MIGIPETGILDGVIIGGHIREGLNAFTLDGKPAHFAIVDDDGRIIKFGPAVAREVWNVTIKAYKLFQIGEGHLTVYSEPPGLLVV